MDATYAMNRPQRLWLIVDEDNGPRYPLPPALSHEPWEMPRDELGPGLIAKHPKPVCP